MASPGLARLLRRADHTEEPQGGGDSTHGAAEREFPAKSVHFGGLAAGETVFLLVSDYIPIRTNQVLYSLARNHADII